MIHPASLSLPSAFRSYFTCIEHRPVLAIVAYPLWVRNELTGSAAEGMTRVFVWVVFPIVAMPWGYFFRTLILDKRTA
jgi:hypothetical protein